MEAVKWDGSPLYPCERTEAREAEEREAKRRKADGSTALPERETAREAGARLSKPQLQSPVMNDPSRGSTPHPHSMTKGGGLPLIAMNDGVSACMRTQPCLPASKPPPTDTVE